MSYDKTKTDPALGQKVHEHLVSIGVETPIYANGLSRREKIDKIESHFDEIVSIRRDIHMYPETGFDVHRTAGIVAKQLEDSGLKVREGAGAGDGGHGGRLRAGLQDRRG